MSELCFELHSLFNGLDRYRFPFSKENIPLNGIYILFESTEKAHGADRIVRAGTHTGSNQLRSRLKQHFIDQNKDRSIFRKNIGRALLNKAKNPFLDKWELDLTTREAKLKYAHLINFDEQAIIENQVSQYIQENFSFVVFEMNNKEERLLWESRIISTVSLCSECKPSSNWLGNFSTKEKIKESGLWLVNELYKKPINQQEFEVLRKISLN